MLAGMRAREYRNDLSSTKSGSQLAIMQERNRILEEQVRSARPGAGRRGRGGRAYERAKGHDVFDIQADYGASPVPAVVEIACLDDERSTGLTSARPPRSSTSSGDNAAASDAGAAAVARRSGPRARSSAQRGHGLGRLHHQPGATEPGCRGRERRGKMDLLMMTS
jgi:hypothetical protein